MTPDPFGPWAPNLSDAERLARYRSLRGLVQLLAGAKHPFVIALAKAEANPSDEAALAAWTALTSLPARQRRNVLASLAELTRTTIRERKTG